MEDKNKPEGALEPEEKKRIKKGRLVSLVLFFLLLSVEFMIGLFVHDRFVRPYVGDVLVVILLYFLVRAISFEKPRYLSVWILLFAVFVEITQIYPLVDLLGIRNRFIRVVMGTSFAWKDMLAYAVGTIVGFVIDLRLPKERTQGAAGKASGSMKHSER